MPSNFLEYFDHKSCDREICKEKFWNITESIKWRQNEHGYIVMTSEPKPSHRNESSQKNQAWKSTPNSAKCEGFAQEGNYRIYNKTVHDFSIKTRAYTTKLVHVLVFGEKPRNHTAVLTGLGPLRLFHISKAKKIYERTPIWQELKTWWDRALTQCIVFDEYINIYLESFFNIGLIFHKEIKT